MAVSPVAVTAVAQTGEPLTWMFLSKTISILVSLVALAELKAGAVPAVTVKPTGVLVTPPWLAVILIPVPVATKPVIRPRELTETVAGVALVQVAVLVISPVVVSL